MSIKRVMQPFNLAAAIYLSFFSSVYAGHLDDAKQAIEAKQIPAAIIHLKNQLKETPKNAEARFLLGKLYLQTGKLESSIKELGRAHEYDPSNIDILFTYSEVLRATGQWDRMLQILNQPLNDTQQESKRLSYRGYAFLGKNQLADARQAFDEANQQEKTAIAFNGLASLSILEKNFQTAQDYLDEASTLEKNNPYTLHLMAKVAVFNKQYDKALELYNQIIQARPHQLSYYLERATILAALNRSDAARKDLDVVLKKNSQHPQANFIKAQLLFKEQKFQEAHEAATIVVNTMPRFMPGAYMLAATNFALQNYNSTIEYLLVYLSAVPNDVKAQNLLATTYLEQQKTRKALVVLEGIPKDVINKNVFLLVTLGTAHIQNKETDKGIALLQQAQKLAPNDQNIKKRLVAAQFQSGEYDSAIKELEELSLTESTSENDKIQTDYVLIISYIRQKQLDKASTKLNELLGKTPNDTRLLNLQALVSQLKGDSDTATSQYNAILKQDKNNIPAYLGLARIAAMQSNWTETSRYFQQILKINPDMIKAYLGLAAVAEKQNKPELTEDYFLQALNRSKKNLNTEITVASLLGQWYQKQKKPEKIYELAKIIESHHPNNNIARSFMVKALLANNNRKDAEKVLRRIILDDKQDIKHRILLVQLISLDESRTQEAIDLLKSAQVIAPYEANLYTLQAALYLKNQQFEQAFDVARSLKENIPAQPTGDLLKADIYRAQKQFDQALAIYEESYKKHPDKKVFNAIIDMSLILKKYEKAFAMLHEYLEKNPDDIDNLFKLASLYHEKKQLEQAEKYYLQIINQIPNHIVSLNNMAWIYMDSDTENAVKLAHKAHLLAPKSAAIADTYGFALVKNKQLEQGLDILENAAKKIPEDYDVQYHLAYALNQTGDKARARSILSKITVGNKNFSEKENAEKLLNNL
jgi:putative PEP-CTERM system TPR-repeat lipoprotein